MGRMQTSQSVYYATKAKRDRRRHVGWLVRKSFPFAVVGGLALYQYLVPNKLEPNRAEIAARDRSAEAYYPNCDAARAAGVAPIRIGQPGYRDDLDGDDDGIACEPYRGSR